MILHLVIAHPPHAGDIFNYITGSDMSNSIVKITRTSTQTAKHTQEVWEIIRWLVYLELCAGLASWLQKGLGTSMDGLANTVSSDQPYPPCKKKEGKLCNCYAFFCIEKGSDFSLEKDSLPVYKLIPREQCDLLR